jgi:zinc transport system ATP-binding protein
MATKIIEFENVSFSYGKQPALNKATFSISENDFLGIIGPNGGGKTTIIKLILGFLSPDSGEVRLYGKTTGGSGELQKRGYVPQRASSFDQNFPATVFEVASMGRFAKIGMMRRLSRKDYAIVDDALATVDMLSMRDKRIGDLSGGQQQRVFIARALAAQPEILVLDEPLAGVDMASQHKFYELLRHLNKDMGLTIILVSHDVGMITKTVTKLACVNVNVTVHDTSKGIDEADLTCAYSEDLSLVPHHHD